MVYSIRLLVLCLFMAALPSALFAQGTIEGTVTDARNDEPIPGAQVVVVGTQVGAATDADGAFSITGVSAGEVEVQARFVGYRTMSETINVTDGQTTTVDFALRESVVNMDEIVVTGAGGPVEKRKLGNSIASISGADLETAPIQSFSDIIQGREPGLVGLPSGGLSGEGSRIRIRGSASLTQSNEPLVYVDGVRINNGGGFGGFVSAGGGGSPSRLDDINPIAIERVEIIKGAAAATLYGTQASNGVIQIFTKRGDNGPLQVNFSTELTAVTFPDQYPDQVGFARTQEQADRINSIIGSNVGPYELVSQNIARQLTDGTGLSQTYAGSISGGSEGITYFVSGRFQGENGPFDSQFIRNPGYPDNINPLASDELRRYQGTANLSITPNENFQMFVSTGYTDTYLSTIQTNNNIYGTISLAQFSKPELVQPNNRSGTIAFASVNESLQQTVSQTTQRFYGTVGITYSPIEMFEVQTNFGVDFTDASSEEVRPFGWNIDNFATDTPDGEKAFADNSSLYLTFDSQGRLNNELSDDFESTLLVGAQGFLEQGTIESGLGTNFPGPGFEVTEAAAIQALFETFSEVVSAGAYAQEQIGFRDFLFGTVGVRYDVSSAFGDDFSGVWYPKVSASFIPSDAPFWNPVGPLSSLRLRAAVGQSGLQPGAFDALTTFTSLSSQNGAGIVPDNLGNPSLKPEISTEWEVGAEIGLFNDRASVEGTYWNRTVRDALVDRQFPVTGGFRNVQLTNIGELKGQGIELAINANVLEGERLRIDAFANTAYLYQEVTDLGGAPPIKVGGSYPRYRNYLVEGFAPGSHFGVQLLDVPEGSMPVDFNGDGVPDTEAQVLAFLDGLTPEDASLPSSTARVLLATDPNSPTGTPTDFYLGKPTPDWSGSFGVNIGFLKQFELSTLFEYKAGNYYVNNLTDAFRQANASIGRNLPESARAERDFITGGIDANGNPQNDGEVRLAALNTWLNDLLALSPFSGLNTIEKADFLRWRELSLTYRVPAQFLEPYRLRSMSLTLTGRNLAIFTGYGGVDPELNAVGRGGGDGDDAQLDNNFLDGVEAFGFPIPRRFGFKLQVGI